MTTKKSTQSKAPSKAKKAKSKGKVPAARKKPAELSDEELDDVSGGAGYTSLSGGYASFPDNTLQDNTLNYDTSLSSTWFQKK